MAVDVIRIRCPVVGTQAPGAGSPWLQVGPAQGGPGEAPLAAPSSRCPLRSARARIGFTHLVESVPYSCASARRGGVDGGGVRRRPGRIARNADEAVKEVLRHRSSQRRPAWRLCASTAHGSQRRRPGLCKGRWMIATGDDAAVRRARGAADRSGRTRGGLVTRGTRTREQGAADGRIAQNEQE